jgi:hypothetical protein
MDFVYNDEVKRTNRIGVGMTGLHEFAWKFFKIGFKDMISMETEKPSKKVVEFWETLNRFNNAVIDEAKKYSKELGVVVPHTALTMKPAGTTSKLFGLSEGAHLPALKEYIRWVQFRNDDPLIAKYQKKGYQTKELKQYAGMTIVGFPTVPEICKLGMGDALMTAPEASPSEQYTYLRLLEKYWIHGTDPRTDKTRTPRKTKGNQVSYTLKYYKDRVSQDELLDLVLKNQGTIACCSIMPSEEKTAYEYLPEQAVTRIEFENICSQINDEEEVEEDIGREHIDCENGACPIDFKEEKS